MKAKDAFLGRVLLGWSRDRLAQESEVPVSEVYTFERIGEADPAAVAKMKAVLEVGGIEFVQSEDGGPGVRLRKAEPLTPEQCRAARELLRWSRERLAAICGVYAGVIQRFETEGRLMRPMDLSHPADRLAAIRAALEQAGAEFVESEEPGVRLRKQGE